MRSTLYGSLMIMVFWNTSLKHVRSTSVNRYGGKCKIYEIDNPETNFKNAQATCELNGGMLAQISQQTVTDNFYAPFSRFLRSAIGGNCTWIGARDNTVGGWWTWTDGTPVLSVPWTIPPGETFYQFRTTLNCGRLCQGDNKWIWEPVSCEASLKFVCEYEVLDAEHCISAYTTPTRMPHISPKGESIRDLSRYMDGVKIFKFPDNETDFANAMAFCKRDGGRLAIIKPEPGTMMLNASVSRFLDSRVGESCVFIGASDRDTEGIWLWIDGTPTYSVRWAVDCHFHMILRHTQDCGRLCPDPKRGWVWKKDYCDDSKFMCEYDEPALERTEEPVSKPKVKPALKPKRTPVGYEGY